MLTTLGSVRELRLEAGQVEHGKARTWGSSRGEAAGEAKGSTENPSVRAELIRPSWPKSFLRRQLAGSENKSTRATVDKCCLCA